MAKPIASQAVYSLEANLTFVGPIPNGQLNQAAPEVAKAHNAAIKAMRSAMREHGFSIAGTNHESKRIGTILNGIAVFDED